MARYTGKCFCGAVEIEVNGAPEAMGYCHCNSCRSWSAAPVNAFSLWKPETVKVTKGEEFVGHFMKTSMSDRQYCTKCGGHLLTDHPLWALVDVYAATIPSLQFKPSVHVNYAETVLPMKDGLPQAEGLPRRNGWVGHYHGRAASFQPHLQEDGRCSVVSLAAARQLYASPANPRRSYRPLRHETLASARITSDSKRRPDDRQRGASPAGRCLLG